MLRALPLVRAKVHAPAISRPPHINRHSVSVTCSAIPSIITHLRDAEQRLSKSLIVLSSFRDHRVTHIVLHWSSFLASVAFVALYVWSTYSPPVVGSFRAQIELFLCVLFASEYVYRLVIVHKSWDSKVRTMFAFRNIADLLAFGPPILEVVLQRFTPFSLGGLDLRWFKILRSLRVLRVGLLGGELRSLHLSTKRGASLSAGANFRLFQLGASIASLLFMTTSVIAIVEQMTFHKALYFTITTLTTVGYGDVVPKTFLGGLVVLAAICVGVVLIPVQATQFYTELNARRVVRGTLPDRLGAPFILLSTRLTEVRAFGDFYSEFQQALRQSLFASTTKLVVLCNRPSFEFGAFQEANERSIILAEGSAVSGADLITVGAERSRAILLLADRFTTDPEQEDLGILFQVWACKSYTKTVPLYVQTVRKKMVDRIAPFLDPGQDVIVSMEQIRLRLLALSAVCPGASTLIGNLLKSSNVKPPEARDETLAGRKWLRAYVDGCAFQLCEAPVLKHVAGALFIDISAWLYENTGFVTVGIIDHDDRLLINPAQNRLKIGQTLIVLGTSKKIVIKAMKELEYTPMTEDTRTELLSEYSGESFKGWAEEPECVPVYLGPPDSDSMDADSALCIPAELAGELMVKEDESPRFRGATATLPSSKIERAQPTNPIFSGHFILCGHEESFRDFIQQLRKCIPRGQASPIVILHPTAPAGITFSSTPVGKGLGPIVHVRGSAADSISLRAAGAPTARALIYLAKTARPVKSAQATGAVDIATARSTREAVLADADALLACYGVGEESGAELTHAVVELLFTTSIEFLQPGLLLKGVSNLYDDSSTPTGAPRKSWSMRAWQQRESVAEGLAEWQANPYYAAGRVTVPALMDTFACQSFFGQGLLIDLLGELSGDCSKGPCNGASLQQIQLPVGMAGRTYGDLYRVLALTKDVVCLGLYRRKTENLGTRLSYVVANPPSYEKLEATDKVFILRENLV